MSNSPEHISLQGRELAGFRLLSEIGRGNNGVVYLARQIAMQRDVAFKLLLPELAADPGYVRNFLHEARLAARLDHPNIVQALDAGTTPEGFYFFAMEYVPGNSLEELRLHNAVMLTPEFLRQTMLQLTDAMAYAWNFQRMIHGDIKPGNLLIRKPDQLLKLADLGLARISGTDAGDDIMATPLYAAPEVITADHANIGVASDLYSFGVMYYELLAGRAPFRGNTDAILQQHLYAQPVPLLTRCPQLDPGIAELITRLLSKTPADRPHCWEEVKELLQNSAPASANVAAVAKTPDAPSPKFRLPSSLLRRTIVIVLVTLAMILFGGFLYLGIRLLTIPEPSPITLQIAPQSEPPVQQEPQIASIRTAISGQPATREPLQPKPATTKTKELPKPPPISVKAPSAEPPAPAPALPPTPTPTRTINVAVPAPPKTEIPAAPAFAPAIDQSRYKSRLERIYFQIDRLDIPLAAKEQLWQAGKQSYLLLGQLESAGLSGKEVLSLEINANDATPIWRSIGGDRGDIKLPGSAGASHLMLGLGYGFGEQMVEEKKLPPGWADEMAQAFQYFVSQRIRTAQTIQKKNGSYQPGNRPNNLILQHCQYNLFRMVQQLKSGELRRFLLKNRHNSR